MNGALAPAVRQVSVQDRRFSTKKLIDQYLPDLLKSCPLNVVYLVP